MGPYLTVNNCLLKASLSYSKLSHNKTVLSSFCMVTLKSETCDKSR